MELTVTDDPMLNVTRLVGRVYDYEGGTLLLESRLSDTNLLGVERYRSGKAGVNVGYEDLHATFDDIRAQTIPEPGTIAMLLAGSLCLLGIAWRRRRT
jgi:hypothetical protein